MAGTTRLQPHRVRSGRGAVVLRRRLDLARSVGKRRLGRLRRGLRGHVRGASLGAVRRDLGLPGVLRNRAVVARGVAGRSARRSAAHATERRAHSVRVLHDFRSQDHAQLTRRSRGVRSTGGPGRRLGTPGFAREQRIRMGTHSRFATDPRHQSLSARSGISMDERAQRGFVEHRRKP